MDAGWRGGFKGGEVRSDSLWVAVAADEGTKDSVECDDGGRRFVIVCRWIVMVVVDTGRSDLE